MKVLTNTNRKRSNGPKQAAGLSSGKGLSVKRVSNWIVFALFLSAIGIGYIWNAYYAERQVQRRDALRKEVKELRDQYYLQKADRQASVRFAEIAKNADTLNLKRPQKPPFRLKINE
ncbi:MAG: FtsL-like putative cell division protein [Bacteroidia bacterium]